MGKTAGSGSNSPNTQTADNLGIAYKEMGLLEEAIHVFPYLVIGVLFEAIIRTFKWHVKIRHALTRFGHFSIVMATLLGVASPLCACSTLPLVISLFLAGLPLGELHSERENQLLVCVTEMNERDDIDRLARELAA